MSEAQKEYNALFESGELLMMFPNLKGDWDKDKKSFTRYYEDNQRLLNENIIDLDDEDDNTY